jgi:acid stress-induced BolA-like protein IbaG/YrbA
METEAIKQKLIDALDLELVRVTGEGSHFQVTAVGSLFEGLSRVKQQQLVYAPLATEIAENTIHALTIKAYTPSEWQTAQKFGQPF